MKPGADVIIRKIRFSLLLNPLFLLILLSGCASLSVLPGAKLEQTDDRQVEFALVKHDGSDTVVFENGLGAQIDSWKKVFLDISQDTTAFAYNRPGYGKSVEVSTPRDGAHIVDELRSLLRSQGLHPPYILVGHSVGGLYMQLFARRYPDEVQALILVDSTHPLQFKGSGAPEYWPFWLRIGFWMWMSRINEKEFNGINKTGEDLLALPAFTGKPVMVLTAFKTPKEISELVGAFPADEKSKSRLAQLYPGSRQVWVISGHDIPRKKPEPIISLIRGVLSKNERP
jgi:hypothetical protein